MDEEIKKALEDEEDFSQDQMYDQWSEAHEKYDNGDKKMLENLISTKGRLHTQNTLAELKKKGQEIDYDKFDTSLIALILTSSSFIVHPVIISGWLTICYKITVDSYRAVEAKADSRWEKLDQFGPELFYFLATTLATIYFFVTIQQQSIVLSDGGTFMQILVEVINLVR